MNRLVNTRRLPFGAFPTAHSLSERRLSTDRSHRMLYRRDFGRDTTAPWWAPPDIAEVLNCPPADTFKVISECSSINRFPQHPPKRIGFMRNSNDVWSDVNCFNYGTRLLSAGLHPSACKRLVRWVLYQMLFLYETHSPPSKLLLHRVTSCPSSGRLYSISNMSLHRCFGAVRHTPITLHPTVRNRGDG